MEPIGCPETSVRNYHYSLRNDPEERGSRLLRGGSLKSATDDKSLSLATGFKRCILCSLEMVQKHVEITSFNIYI